MLEQIQWDYKPVEANLTNIVVVDKQFTFKSVHLTVKGVNAYRHFSSVRFKTHCVNLTVVILQSVVCEGKEKERKGEHRAT